MRKSGSGMMLGLTLIGAVGAAETQAATYYVPDDFLTIQAAIDASASGDTLLVKPGTYHERLTITKAITLKSTEGPNVTILDGDNAGTVLSIRWDPARATVDGFTITNGNGWAGGGVYVIQADPTIKNSIITGNRASYGAGVYAYYGACYLSLENVTISNNVATHDGGGIYGNISCVPVTDSDIVNNTAGGNGGGIAGVGYCGGVWAYSANISGNVAGKYGGGIYSGDGSPSCPPIVIARTSLVSGNSAQVGGGVYTGYYGRALLDDSTIAGNAADLGGGFYATADTYVYEIINSIIWGNSSPSVIPESVSYATVTYSDLEGGVPGRFLGNGNISADPLFVDPANGNYQLAAGSPAIDSGQAVVGTDLLGTPRPQGRGDDMGAFEAPACLASPAIEISDFSPTSIWPPNNRGVDLTLSGRIVLAENCTLLAATYRLQDEYGVYSTSDSLTVADDGSFTLTAPVVASRQGNDRDGRLYTLTIIAEDEAGQVEQGGLDARVPHDQR